MNEQYILRELKRLKHRICCVAQGGSSDPEILSSEDITIGDPAPEGILFGFNPVTGDTYYVDGDGNWQAASSGGGPFLNLGGTAVSGGDVTGEVAFYDAGDDVRKSIKYNSSYGDFIFGEDNAFVSPNGFYYNDGGVSTFNSQQDGFKVSSLYPTSKGLYSNQYFPNKELNTYAQMQDLIDGYIPLNGTEVGSPITGNLYFEFETIPRFNISPEEGIIFTGGPSEFYTWNGGQLDFKNTTGGFLIQDLSDTPKGLVGNNDFSANYDDNTYIQKIYVDGLMKVGSEEVVFDGVQTVFNFPHGLATTPSSMAITFGDGQNLEFIQSIRTVDETNITVTCDSAPSGSMTIYWQVFK